MVEIRPALCKDFPIIQRMLLNYELPVVGVEERLSDFFVAVDEGELIAVMGLEVYEDLGLLRSLAVAREYRGRGVAKRLCKRVSQHAARRGIKKVYLLTLTAERFFLRQGFARLSRERAPDAIRSSEEFQNLCSASAVLMCKALQDGVECAPLLSTGGDTA